MQKEVAALVGVSRSAYLNLETGSFGRFPVDTAKKLANLYQIPVTDPLNGDNRSLEGTDKIVHQSIKQ